MRTFNSNFGENVNVYTHSAAVSLVGTVVVASHATLIFVRSTAVKSPDFARGGGFVFRGFLCLI